MSSWQVQKAKAHFSELLDQAELNGPQIITRHGTERAVVLSIERYRAITAPLAAQSAASGPSYHDFKDWLLNGPKLEDDDPFFAALERDRNDTGRDFEFE